MTDCRILVTTEKNETLYIALADEKPVYLTRAQEMNGGSIFVGRVENCLQNLKAAFVRFDGHEIGYLPFADVPPGALLNRAYKQNDALKTGDLLCVQLKHAARGTKQARLTGYLTLHGDFAVLGLEKRGTGCSKALSQDFRRELVSAFKTLYEGKDIPADQPAIPQEHFGVVLRTACGALFERHLEAGKSREDAVRDTATEAMADAQKLYAKLEEIVQTGKTREAGSVLYVPDADAEANERLTRVFHFLERAYPGSFVDIVCASESLHARALKASCASNSLVRVRVNTELNEIYGVSGILQDLTHRVVWLKSGACLVIEETEALTVVDVNSGKYISKKDDDFRKVNFEAADAVMRELRLRDLTGIIVVDFINMRENTTCAALKERLTTLAALDPVHTRFHDITALGLAEITRTAQQ